MIFPKYRCEAWYRLWRDPGFQRDRAKAVGEADISRTSKISVFDSVILQLINPKLEIVNIVNIAHQTDKTPHLSGDYSRD